MFEVFDGSEKDPKVKKALAALAGGDDRHLIIRLSPEDGGWAWLAKVQHDVTGAIRSFKYLADKAKESYADDPRGDKVMASIAKHLATMEKLKADLLDKLV